MIGPLTTAPPSARRATALPSRWCGHNQASTTPGLDAGNVTPLWRPGGGSCRCRSCRTVYGCRERVWSPAPDEPGSRCHVRTAARRHRPARRVPARRAGRAPRAAPPQHHHRRGDRATRRRCRPGRAPAGCGLAAAAPGPAWSRRRLRAAVLMPAHARAGKARHPHPRPGLGQPGARRPATGTSTRCSGPRRSTGGCFRRTGPT